MYCILNRQLYLQHMSSLNHISSITNTVISPLGYTTFSYSAVLPSGSGCWFRHGLVPSGSMTLWLPPPKRPKWMRSNKVAPNHSSQKKQGLDMPPPKLQAFPTAGSPLANYGFAGDTGDTVAELQRGDLRQRGQA
jgi:hypothetical protein